MLWNNIQPAKNLESIVRFYRIIDFDFTGDQAPKTKAYRPRIEHCLQFTPFDRELVDYKYKKAISHSIALFGQQTELAFRKVGQRFLNFQVVFQPGILHSLFKESTTNLTNEYADAELFFSKEIYDVNAQLVVCKTYPEMIQKVESFLSSLSIVTPHPINRIAKELASSLSPKGLEWYANQANLSYRQFDRVFEANVGISPKDYRTLAKLDNAYLLKNRKPGSDWLSIALESGFYDYQHLRKAYKKYLGYSPTEFYQLEQQAPERHFGDFEQ